MLHYGAESKKICRNKGERGDAFSTFKVSPSQGGNCGANGNCFWRFSTQEG